MARVQQHGATPQRMPLADVLSNQGIDGQRTGTARPFPLSRLESGPYRRPSIQIFGSGIPPGPNSWPPNIPSANSVPTATRLSFILSNSVAGLLHTAD